MNNREKMLAKIRALLAKTVEVGATEAEELAPAEKARELIRTVPDRPRCRGA